MNARTGLLLVMLIALPMAAFCQDFPPASYDSIPSGLLHEYDSAATKLNTCLDSLRALQLPQDAYLRRVDSLYTTFSHRDLAALRDRQDSATQTVGRHLQKVDSVIATKRAFLDSLLRARGSLPVQTDLSIPNASAINPGGMAFPHTPTLPDIPELSLPSVNIAVPELATPAIPDALTNINNKAGELSKVAGDAGAVIKEVEAADVGATVDKLADQQAQKLASTSGLTDAASAGEAAKSALLATPKPDAAAMQKQAKETFVDHFAGKEAVVQKDMESIAKTQLKYGTVNDSRQLPKRVPNAMKGKPFIERLVPGLSVQLITAQNVSLDIAPSIAYKLSGRLRVGVGGFKRVTYFKRARSVQTEDVCGLRIYGEVKIRKLFYVHIEPELYRDRRPNAVPPSDQPRNWQRRLNVGILKTYTLGKHWAGTVTALYDVFDLRNFPNTRGGGVRVGVEYKLLRREKKGSI